MEASSALDTPGEQLFTDAQLFVSNDASEMGLFSADGCYPALFPDSGDLLGGLGGLGDVVCWSDNVDHCISYLNKELVMLGLPALYKDDGSGDGSELGFDLLALINGTCRLLNLYQGVSSKLSDLEAEERRRAGELDYLRSRHGKLKTGVPPTLKSSAEAFWWFPHCLLGSGPCPVEHPPTRCQRDKQLPDFQKTSEGSLA